MDPMGEGIPAKRAQHGSTERGVDKCSYVWIFLGSVWRDVPTA